MEFVNREPKIFILSGKAKSGKNEVADIIASYYDDLKCIKVSFGKYLKEYAKKITKWDGLEETKPRTLLQELGIDLIKEKIDDRMLIRRVIEDIKVYSYFADVIIVTDARLTDEIELLKTAFDNVVTIRINRDVNNKLTKEQKEHVTETALDDYLDFDYVIDNDDYRDLEEDIINILEVYDE